MKVRPNAFTSPRDTNEVSVNRMNFASREDLAHIGQRGAGECGKQFWGWNALTEKQVEETKCKTIASPLDDNPYHADIVMPGDVSAKDCREEFRQFAYELALVAEFIPWVDWTRQAATSAGK